MSVFYQMIVSLHNLKIVLSCQLAACSFRDVGTWATRCHCSSSEWNRLSSHCQHKWEQNSSRLFCASLFCVCLEILIYTKALLKPDHNVTSDHISDHQVFFFKWLHLISRHSTSAALYLLITSLWTRIQMICQCTNSRSNICLLSIGERLALLYLASRHFHILCPTKTETGPGFMSFPSYAHADTNSCFELQPLRSVFLFSRLWTQLGERTQSNPFHTGCRSSWGGLPPRIW